MQAKLDLGVSELLIVLRQRKSWPANAYKRRCLVRAPIILVPLALHEKENMSNYQDWEPQVIRKTPVRSADARSKTAVNMALRSGVGVETEKKCMPAVF